MSEGLFGNVIGGALGGALAAHQEHRARQLELESVRAAMSRPGAIVRVPDIADAMAMTFAASASQQSFFVPSATDKAFRMSFPASKPKPLLGETYMYPDERPVEPL